MGGGESPAQAELRAFSHPLHKGPARPPSCVVSRRPQALTPEGQPPALGEGFSSDEAHVTASQPTPQSCLGGSWATEKTPHLWD